MTIRQLSHGAGHCLRAAAAPVLTLGVLTLARMAYPGAAVSTSMDELILLAWRGGTSATLVWLVVAVSWAATRPWRDLRAFQRLQQLRDLAGQPNRAFVQVRTTIWSNTAGQHAVALNVATGILHRVWLSETTVPIGSFVVLERTNGGVRVIDYMDAPDVEAAHRHERRNPEAQPATPAHPTPTPTDPRKPDDAATLIHEVEEYLRRR